MLQHPFFSRISSDDFAFGLGSDNHTGAHPRILAAIEKVNLGWAPAYGTDLVTEEAVRIFRGHFGKDVDVHFCFNGTAANVLSLGSILRSHHAVLASEHAHLLADECAAPENAIGCKFVAIPSSDAKLKPEMLEPYLIRKGDQHFAQVRAVSITQPTELGTRYSRTEIQALVAFCKKHDLFLHIDGARYTNAVVLDGCSLSEMCEGADVLSFGGTKNGLVCGEAVLLLSTKAREAAKHFPFYRKQLMQLPSKTRLIAAQFIEFLGTDLWREIAAHSCNQAKALAEGLHSSSAKVTQTVQSNAVFAIFDRATEKRLRDYAFFYIWNEHTREARLMTSWSTTPEQIQKFIAIAKGAERTES